MQDDQEDPKPAQSRGPVVCREEGFVISAGSQPRSPRGRRARHARRNAHPTSSRLLSVVNVGSQADLPPSLASSDKPARCARTGPHRPRAVHDAVHGRHGEPAAHGRLRRP
ncbi:hypothetical protein CG747_19705 [Streptomyces sp. CB02959]|nr:hypothetical protein CG747_19705 [Streptomyces sp. CB02959]